MVWYAGGMAKMGIIVGFLLKNISRACSLVIIRGGSINRRVTAHHNAVEHYHYTSQIIYYCGKNTTMTNAKSHVHGIPVLQCLIVGNGVSLITPEMLQKICHGKRVTVLHSLESSKMEKD